MSVGSGTRMEPDPRKDTATAQGRLLNVMSAHGGKLGQWLSHPVRSVPLAFIAVILMGTGLMTLPIARTNADVDAGLPALFTAVSAVCVTGLVTVDTPTFWTPFGHAVIIGLIQVGGFGIMTLATLLALLVRKSIGLRGQLVAQSETHTLNFGDVRPVLFRVARIMVVCEAITAAVLTVRFWFIYEGSTGTAIWHGAFHAVSAFNNAGFALYSDSLIGFAGDPWIIVPICLAIIAGTRIPCHHHLVQGRNKT